MQLKIEKTIKRLIDQALAEDDVRRDITTRTLLPQTQRAEAYIVVKEPAVLCGLAIAQAVFKRLDKHISFRSLYTDGAKVKPLTRVAILKGNTRSLLAGERTALNFLGHLCGIATLAHAFVQKTKGTEAKILDTRKTLPGLRILQKHAVRCGGGMNHRFNLNEAALIKDNHLALLGKKFSYGNAVSRLRNKAKKIIFEVQNLRQLPDALAAQPDVILLDNMTFAQIRKAVAIRNRLNKQVRLEVSGGIHLKNVRQIAQSGVDRISIGALTHSAPNIDLSMEIITK